MPSSPAARSSISNSGLLTSSDNVNQVQGVIAHELGHVAGGHAIRMQEGARQATGITHRHAWSSARSRSQRARAKPAWDFMAAGQQAAMGQFLAFTRTQETQRRPGRRQYLSKAGISGKGRLEFFRKLQNQEYRLAIYAKDSYDRTHPLIGRAYRRARETSTRRTRPGTARPIRRWRRGSSG